MTGLQDGRGCLTAAGIQAFKGAPPGQAPPELARHVAACARCQDRALAADPGTFGPGQRRRRPPAWRLGLLFLVALGCALMLFAWLGRLLSGG